MEHRIKIFFFLDQEDFGDKRNCSLTSITSICYTRFRNPSEKEIYNIVESIGKKYCYNDKRGTNPLFIKNIFNKSLEYFSHFQKDRITGLFMSIKFLIVVKLYPNSFK